MMVERRQCWICYETEGENGVEEDWVEPCGCRGSTRAVHRLCLNRWLRRQHPTNPTPRCPQCGTYYRFKDEGVLSKTLVLSLDYLEHVKERVCMYSMLVGIMGAGYVVTSFYGGMVLVATVDPKHYWPVFLSILRGNDRAWLAWFRATVGLPLITTALLSRCLPIFDHGAALVPLVLFRGDDGIGIGWTWPPSPSVFALGLQFGIFGERWVRRRVADYFVQEEEGLDLDGGEDSTDSMASNEHQEDQFEEGIVIEDAAGGQRAITSIELHNTVQSISGNLLLPFLAAGLGLAMKRTRSLGWLMPKERHLCCAIAGLGLVMFSDAVKALRWYFLVHRRKQVLPFSK